MSDAGVHEASAMCAFRLMKFVEMSEGQEENCDNCTGEEILPSCHRGMRDTCRVHNEAFGFSRRSWESGMPFFNRALVQ
jgi:hypothetical protein